MFVQAALVSIPEPEFAVSLLVTVRQFPGTLPVQQNILNILEHTFSQHPVSLDTKARMCLEKVNNIYLCNFFWPEFFVCLRFKNIFNHERSKGLKILSLNRKQIKKVLMTTKNVMIIQYSWICKFKFKEMFDFYLNPQNKMGNLLSRYKMLLICHGTNK